MHSPLAGIKVLDLSRVLAGPTCAQTLADLGANVIKIERPEVGDDSRGWGPCYVKGADGKPTQESGYFCAANAGKRSVAADISTKEGQELVKKLAESADVLIENYRVGSLRRYGLNYEALSKANPRLVYCSITGFGQTGPYRDRPGYDTVIQALAGVMSLSGRPDGSPGEGPVRSGLAASDLLTALYSTVAILSALRQRDATGEGQYIDSSLLDVLISSLSFIGVNYLIGGHIPPRKGNAHNTVYPSDAFGCSDGYVMVMAGTNDQFARLCGLLGTNEVLADPRFTTNDLRVKNYRELAAILAPKFEARTQDEWIEALTSINVPVAPIHDLSQVFEDPHVKARGLVTMLKHPVIGDVPSLASPLRMSKAVVRANPTIPLLGQHTDEVVEAVARGANGW